MTRIEQALNYAQERRGEPKETPIKPQPRADAQHLYVDRKRLSDWERELEQSAPALIELKAGAQEASESLATAENAVQAWSQNWSSTKVSAFSQTAEGKQSRIAYLEQVLTKLQEQARQQQHE